MKYYKSNVEEKNVEYSIFYKKEKIFPEGTTRIPGETTPVERLFREFPGDFTEVSAAEYYVQEGKLPENYVVECGSSQESSMVVNSITKESMMWSWWKYCYTYPNFTGLRITNDIRSVPKEYPLFTFEQWNQIINKNMKKEFVLPKNWCVNATTVEQALVIGTYFDKVLPSVTPDFYKDNKRLCYYGFSGRSGDVYDNRPEFGYTEITFEQFEKYVLKLNNMKIIGYKFKENLFDAENKSRSTWLKNIASFGLIHDQMENPDENEILKIIFENSLVKSHFDQAGVFDLWFEPVYEVFKFNDWVTDDDGQNIYQIDIKKDGKYYPKKGIYTSDLTLIDSPQAFGPDLRKATEEEILYHLQKIFTFKTNINIGSNVLNNVTNYKVSGFHLFYRNRCDGKKSLATSKWFEKNPNEDYQLGILCGDSTLSPDCKLVSDPDIVINGHKAGFFKNYIKFGCAEIDKDVFIKLYTILKVGSNNVITVGNKQIESVTIGKGIFTSEQVKEIAEYYLKQ